MNTENYATGMPHGMNIPVPIDRKSLVESLPPNQGLIFPGSPTDKPTPSSTRNISIVNPTPHKTETTDITEREKSDDSLEVDSCCVSILKIMSFPIVFVAGTVFGAIYGAFCGVIHAALIIKDVYDMDEIQNFCSTSQLIAMSPLIIILSTIVIAVCTVRYAAICTCIAGIAIFAKLLCSKMRSDDGYPLFEREPQCKNIPLFLWCITRPDED